MAKTMEDLYNVLSEILIVIKDSANNRSETIEIDASFKNTLPPEINLNDFPNWIIKSKDESLTTDGTIVTGKGFITINWKE